MTRGFLAVAGGGLQLSLGVVLGDRLLDQLPG